MIGRPREEFENGYAKIVLNDNDVGLGLDERADDARCLETLLHIKIRRRLVKHVHVRFLRNKEEEQIE